MDQLRDRRPRASTIRSSSYWMVVGLTLPWASCAASALESAAFPSREAPAPHLRGAASGLEHAAHGEHVDPVPDPRQGSAVSLGGMLAYADLHSPLLRVARTTRSRAEAARVAAEVLLPDNPELTVAAGPRWGRAGTALELEASLTQSFALSGERAARLDAAARLRELTDAEIEQMRWAVHCDVHAAFHRVLVENERAALAERVVAFQEDVLRVVQRQIAAGETPPLTLRLAEGEVAQARQELVLARQALLVSRLRLAQLSGWPSADPPSPGGAVDSPHDPPALARLLAVARAHLPSLRTAAARVRETESRVDVAGREGWPRPSLGVQYRREGNPSAEEAYDIVMGVLSLPVPLVQRGQGERARAEADRAVARAELEAEARLLEARITEARSEVLAAAGRTRAYGREILPRFEENLTLLRRSFELGEIDLLALSTGRERFLRIQSDALAAQLDYFVALAALERVVGIDLWRDDHHHGDTPR